MFPGRLSFLCCHAAAMLIIYVALHRAGRCLLWLAFDTPDHAGGEVHSAAKDIAFFHMHRSEYKCRHGFLSAGGLHSYGMPSHSPAFRLGLECCHEAVTDGLISRPLNLGINLRLWAKCAWRTSFMVSSLISSSKAFEPTTSVNTIANVTRSPLPHSWKLLAPVSPLANMTNAPKSQCMSVDLSITSTSTGSESASFGLHSGNLTSQIHPDGI
jgi:hypothetical protein